MRPGQTAPECKLTIVTMLLTQGGFNEAGADCPGMPSDGPRNSWLFRTLQ